jgi:hypothetical protein
MKIVLLLAGVGLALGVTFTQAATPATGTTSLSPTAAAARIFPTGFFAGFPGGGYSGYIGSGYESDPASTAKQAFDYGVARTIRAESEYLLHASEAALNMQEVYSRRMDNWKKWVATYFEVKRINQCARDAERGKPLTPADYLRMSEMGRPRRMTPSEMQVVTGEIAWPVVLHDEAFTPARDLLGHYFADRASQGVMTLDELVNTEETSRFMLDSLRDRITEYPPDAYMNSRRFVENLAYEARFPAGSGGVAPSLPSVPPPAPLPSVPPPAPQVSSRPGTVGR